MSHIPMTRKEEMLAEHMTPYFHESTFVRLKDGRVLHASGGKFILSEDKGITWGEPFSMKDKQGNPVGGRAGTSLVNLSDNGIGLAGKIIEKGTDYMVFWRSEDGGETWEPPVRLTPPGIDSHALQDVFLRTSNGRIVLPLFAQVYGCDGTDPPPIPLSGKLIRGN